MEENYVKLLKTYTGVRYLGERGYIALIQVQYGIFNIDI